jgi:hypothetical protein
LKAKATKQILIITLSKKALVIAADLYQGTSVPFVAVKSEEPKKIARFIATPVIMAKTVQGTKYFLVSEDQNFFEYLKYW